MPMDGLTLNFIARELDGVLSGGRIDRISQPEQDEIILTIRSKGENHNLLISASAGCARMHITSVKKSNPLEPPMLCMLMRKHIVGGRIKSIKQIGADRIIEINIEHFDELGDLSQKSIICEFMGRHSNIIFVGREGRIIDAARRVNERMSSVREVLPGIKYEPAPSQDKLPFDSIDRVALYSRLASSNGEIAKLLSREISGLSIQSARELAHRVTGNGGAHSDECDLRIVSDAVVKELQNILDHPSPAIYFYPSGECMDVTAFEYLSYSGYEFKKYPDLSSAADDYYMSRDLADRIQQKSSAIRRIIKNNIERCEKKLALQQEALLGSIHMDDYRLYGELINACPHMLRKGEKSVRLINYYDADMAEINIPLDETLSPAQNAQRYFKLYRKARSAQVLAKEQIEKTQTELDYLEGQLYNLTSCSDEAELLEMRQELERLGYVRKNHNRRQQKQLAPSKPLRFNGPDGSIIFVGRNNFQNDKLTFTAEADEVWLHVKDAPGSHVIIANRQPTDNDIEFAASLAARYSSLCQASKVPVDYTRRRYVKKPSGALPGKVIYTNQRTLYVKPAELEQH